jgi:glycosyltransferase involved in cell wall biosynthesis
MAMPAVLESIPQARLRVVGKGDALPSLKALTSRLNLSNAVAFAGFLSDSELSGEFERCRLFALPSEKEGFGIVFLEAMAHGRPCLGARSGGVPEVITPDTGILVEYGNVSGIASALIAGLSRDWQPGPLLERARSFSYSRFKGLLGSLLSR